MLRVGSRREVSGLMFGLFAKGVQPMGCFSFMQEEGVFYLLQSQFDEEMIGVSTFL